MNINKAARKYHKNAVPIAGAIKDALKRHGISGQVTSALAVGYANSTLDQLVDPLVRPDLRALSFEQDKLTVVCQNSAASHLASTLGSDLKEAIETRLPNISVKSIVCKINPHLLSNTSEIH